MYPLPIGYRIGPKNDRPDADEKYGLWDIWNGSGISVIDPHGQLIDDVLENIPKTRTNDIIYFRPADLEQFGSINILERMPRQYQP